MRLGGKVASGPLDQRMRKHLEVHTLSVYVRSMSRDQRRLLLVNSNTTASLTARLHRRASAFLGADWTISAETAGFGSPYITRRTEVAVAAHAVLATIGEVAKAAHEFDACLIACFGEPGIAAAREAFPFPVVGMAEASVLCALQVGRRYAIVTVGEHWPAMIEDYLQAVSLHERCVGIIPVSGQALDLAEDRAFALRQISAAVEQALTRGADAVIVGGAAIADLTQDLQNTFRIPLIDSLDAGLAQVEALARLRPVKSASNFIRQNIPVTTTEGH
jgi:allantoin racemase